MDIIRISWYIIVKDINENGIIRWNVHKDVINIKEWKSCVSYKRFLEISIKSKRLILQVNVDSKTKKIK